MSLTTPVTGGQINASDVAQLVAVLQEPGGAQEVGSYYLVGNAYATGAYIGVWVSTLSRGSAPVSLSHDNTLAAPTNLGSPSTAHLGPNGVEIYASSTGVNVNCYVGGALTIQY